MNKYDTTTITALEDWDSGFQYKAIALDDGLVANNGEEAFGILLNKPKTGEHATVAYFGELDYYAGAAITAGAKLTVASSGWFTTADSSDPVVGTAKDTATSGSIHTGLFNFVNNSYPSNQAAMAVTCALATANGTGYALDDNKNADNGEEFAGVVNSALNSGDTGELVVSGIAACIIGGAGVSAGDMLTCAGSGYLAAGDSGDYIVGQALAAITSGSIGNCAITAIGGYLSV